MKNNWICENTPIIVLYNDKEINPENEGKNCICIKKISELYNKNNIKIFCNRGWIDVKIRKKIYLDDMIEISTDSGYFCCTKETEINGKNASCIKIGDKINTTWNFPYVENDQEATAKGGGRFSAVPPDYWYNIGKNIKDIVDIPIDIFNISIKDQVLLLGGFHSLYSLNSMTAERPLPLVVTAPRPSLSEVTSERPPPEAVTVDQPPLSEVIELNSNILTQYMWILSRKIGYAYKLIDRGADSAFGSDSRGSAVGDRFAASCDPLNGRADTRTESDLSEYASTVGDREAVLDKYRIQRVIFSNGYVKSIKILGVDKKYKTVYNIIPLIDPIRTGSDLGEAASKGGDIVDINIGVGDLVLQF